MFDGLPIAELLSTQNGMWILIVLVGIREYANLTRDRKGPAWVKNGAMDSILDSFTLRLQGVMDKRFEKMNDCANRTEKMTEGLAVSAAGFRKSHEVIAEKLGECGDHLEAQSKVLKAVVREMNQERACPYKPSDAEAIAREVQRKRKADAHTRATDLWIQETE